MARVCDVIIVIDVIETTVWIFRTGIYRVFSILQCRRRSRGIDSLSLTPSFYEWYRLCGMKNNR